MAMRKFRKNGPLYVKLLLGLTLCITLTLIASSSIYYFSYTSITQKEVYESNLSNLRQTSQTVEGTTESAQALSFQIYRNSAVAKLLYYTQPHPFDIQGAMNELNSYLASMPFIQSIYVYNPTSGFYVVSNNGQAGIYTERELADRDILDVLDRFQEFKPFTPIPRMYKASPAADSSAGVYTYLCFEAIGRERKLNSAVVVNLSASWVNRQIQEESFGNHGSTYIVDDRGMVFSGNNLEPQSWDEPERLLLEQSIKNQSNGYILADFKGTKSFISYTAPDKLSWQYVRITPYSTLTEKTYAIRNLTLRIAFGILIAGLFFSWLLSRVMYVPIHRIVKRVHDLESEQRNASYTVRQNALRKLLKVQTFDAQVQLEKLRRTGISFDMTKDYRLLYLRIDQLPELKEQHSPDLLIYKFAILNIASEICSKYYYTESVDLEEEGLLLLLNAMETGEAGSEWLQPMLKQIQRASREYLQIGLTLSITPVSNDPYRLHSLFVEAKEASRQRFFLGREAIIETEKLPPVQGVFAFPSDKEKRMLDALHAGKSEEAKDIVRDILTETAAYPIQAAESAVARLSMTLTRMIAEVERNGSMQLGFAAEPGILSFDSSITLEEALTAFSDFFDEWRSRMVSKRSGKQDELIRKINQMIETRYHDPNLSLNLISDELKMSSFHISRLYRQHTLTTIVDAINGTRMNNAQALLIQSDRSIADIAELTGYTNSSYFHRMFKKTYGVTPSEFRKARA
jgi:AraC-like DNA-binding protein